MWRFRRTMLALALLGVVAVVAVVSERGGEPPDAVTPDRVFAFDREDLVAFSIEHRPDGTDLAFRRVDGEWTTIGQAWRPSASMVRRAAHQLHDLTARADVVEAEEAEPSRYGLGPDALRVTIELADGRELAFAVGDPNPTSVSWYMRPLPDGKVYVVKKAAMDFWRAPVEAFREDRVAAFDADDARRLVAVVDGRALEIERDGEDAYRMVRPVAQPAARDEVRRMLGAVSSVRAVTFVQDGHASLAPAWGLEPPEHTIEVWTSAASPVTVHLGATAPSAPGGPDPLRYAWIGGDDDEVVLIRDGLLDPFRLPLDDYRDRELVPSLHAWEVGAVEATMGGETLVLARSGEEFRWPDGALATGATPRRLTERAADLRAIAFFDDGVPPAGLSFGLEPPWATVALRSGDGEEHRIELGGAFPVEVTVPAPDAEAGTPAPAPRTVDHRFARVDGGGVVEVDEQLAQTVEELFREHGRKAARDADKHLPP